MVELVVLDVLLPTVVTRNDAALAVPIVAILAMSDKLKMAARVKRESFILDPFLMEKPQYASTHPSNC